MTGFRVQSRKAWELASRQEGVVHRHQLLGLGLTRHAIAHRVARGRLHPIWPAVYAVGRSSLTRRGMWWAATLACGEDAAISHGTAAAAWEIRAEPQGAIHVSVPATRGPRLAGIRVHRRASLLRSEIADQEGLRLTVPATTLVDIALDLSLVELERAINAADKLDLIDPGTLRGALDVMPPRPGAGKVRRLLDRWTFVLTDSELEQRFLPIARAAGLPDPLTGVVLNGFKVDFYWPSLGLVVETDGLRYHRTPAEQARDRVRDQAHAAAGLTPLRFTHAQVRYGPGHVERTLRAVGGRAAAR